MCTVDKGADILRKSVKREILERLTSGLGLDSVASELLCAKKRNLLKRWDGANVSASQKSVTAGREKPRAILVVS